MTITIASGKGGTGKTTVATNLARVAQEPVMLLDCDVEEPNSHLFLRPAITSSTPVQIPVPRIDAEKCALCGTCADICAYNAIAVLKDEVLVFDQLCHGCGGCTILCPEHAITEVGQEVGIVETGQADNVAFAHGRLNIGSPMAVPVIKAVKRQAENERLVLLDAPPGTSCPVVISLLSSDFCLLVTEPTPFGLHDLQLAVEVARKLQLPHGVVINRADVGDAGVETYCQNENIPILMQIPTDFNIAEAYSRGKLLVDVLPQYREKFRALLRRCMQMI